MELGQPDALRMEPVQVRRADDGVAMGRDITVALVVGHHVDDVGPLGGDDRRRRLFRCRRSVAGGKRPTLGGDPLPGRLQFRHAGRLTGGEVRRLAAVLGQIVELPGRALGRDELPIANADRTVPLMAPPEAVVGRRRRGIDDRLGKTPTLHRRHGLAVILRRRRDARQREHRRRDIDHMHRLRPEFAACRTSARPVHDPGRCDAPLVDPGLMAAKGSVGTARPAWAETEKRLSRSR